MEIRNATKENILELNHVLRLSKGYWGYDEDKMDIFMNNSSYAFSSS